MSRRRSIAVLGAFLLALGACSGTRPGAAPVGAGTPSTIDPGGGASPRKGPLSHGHGHDDGKAPSGGGRTPGAGPSSGASSGSSGSDDDRAGGPGGAGSGGEPGSSGEAAVAAYPEAGAYVFSQTGTEAFCDPAGNCDDERLPRRQTVATSYDGRSDDEATVVQETRMPGGRLVRTTTHFTPEAAFVTDVYYHLEYRGFDLSEEYRPDPPVPSVRLPLAVGDHWSATWTADTSGDYHARVVSIDPVSVGGKPVKTYRIETLTHFRGEYQGKGSVVIWFDPRTKAIVATNGALQLKASYGSYHTTFETRLSSAPGY